jgi:hypothetical protein
MYPANKKISQDALHEWARVLTRKIAKAYLTLSVLISWSCKGEGYYILKHVKNFFSQVCFFFCFSMNQFDWPIAPKEIETTEAPQNRRSYFDV